jgi:hypothetical protein
MGDSLIDDCRVNRDGRLSIWDFFEDWGLIPHPLHRLLGDTVGILIQRPGGQRRRYRAPSGRRAPKEASSDSLELSRPPQTVASSWKRLNIKIE